jgi:hypothetical protein
MVANKDTGVKLRTNQLKQENNDKKRGRLKITLLIIVVFLIGLPIGYGLLGDASALDIYKPATWGHMLDLIFG